MKTNKRKEIVKSQRGSEILKIILIEVILLVLIITLVYPQMESLFTNMMDTIANWFENVGSKPFQV